MKSLSFLLVTGATLAGALAFTPPASGQADKQSGSIFVTKMPLGYRDWKLISVAHEEGNLNSFAAVLGNDVAIRAYREAKLSFPDGAIIAALHWNHVSSEDNNRVFGRSQSFVAGPSTNVFSPHVLPATRRHLATLSSPSTPLHIENHSSRSQAWSATRTRIGHRSAAQSLHTGMRLLHHPASSDS
jgi:hypothetical protein